MVFRNFPYYFVVAVECVCQSYLLYEELTFSLPIYLETPSIHWRGKKRKQKNFFFLFLFFFLLFFWKHLKCQQTGVMQQIGQNLTKVTTKA